MRPVPLRHLALYLRHYGCRLCRRFGPVLGPCSCGLCLGYLIRYPVN